MKTAFFVVMLFVALFAAMDIIFDDGTRKNKDAQTVAGSLGLKPIRRRPDCVALFLISTMFMSAILIVEVLS